MDVYLLNRSSSKSIGGKTPMSSRSGAHLASVPAYLRLCRTHEGDDIEPKKLDNMSCCTTFIRYEVGSKAYRLYDPSRRRVHVNRDVVVDVAAQCTLAGELGDVADDFNIE